MDVVKIRLQLQVSGDKYQGIFNTMRTIIAEESVFALWKGNVPASAMYVIYGASQFTAYTALNTWMSHAEHDYGIQLGLGSHTFLIGSVSGCVSTVVSYPFDLLRTRFASSPNFHHLYDVVTRIHSTEGPRAFFRGCNTAMATISLYTGLLFWAYEYSRRLARVLDQYSSWAEPVCGFSAGVFAKGVVFPLDLLRKRLQVNLKQRHGFTELLVQVVKREGFKGFYKGFFVSMVKSAPTSALSLWSYEYVMRLMD